MHCDIARVLNCINIIYARKEKNITLSIEVKEPDQLSSTSSSIEEATEMDDVKIKEIIIVTLILTIWLYSLYRSYPVLYTSSLFKTH